MNTDPQPPAPQPRYRCSACGLGVIVLCVEHVIRACRCNAPIAATMTCEMKGAGGVRVR